MGKKKRLWRFLSETPQKKGLGKVCGEDLYTSHMMCLMFQMTWGFKKWKNFGTKDFSNGFLLPKNSQNLTSCWSGFLSGCHFRSNTLNSLGRISGVTVGQWDPKLPLQKLCKCVKWWFSEGFVRYGHSQMTTWSQTSTFQPSNKHHSTIIPSCQMTGMSTPKSFEFRQFWLMPLVP